MAEPLSIKATSCLWADLRQNHWHKETAVRSQPSSPSPLSSGQGTGHLALQPVGTDRVDKQACCALQPPSA